MGNLYIYVRINYCYYFCFVKWSMTANKNIEIVCMSSSDYQNVHNVKRHDFSEVQLVLNPDPGRSPSNCKNENFK